MLIDCFSFALRCFCFLSRNPISVGTTVRKTITCRYGSRPQQPRLQSDRFDLRCDDEDRTRSTREAARLARTGANRMSRSRAVPVAYVERRLSSRRQIGFSLSAANILLCATVFLEDAVHYRSIAHKVTRQYLSVYRWFQSPLIQK